VIRAAAVVVAGALASGGAGLGVTGVTGVTDAGSGVHGVTGATGPIIVPSAPAKLLGQRIMVGFSGLTAPASLLSAIRAGTVGSVILFGGNLSTRTQVHALTGALQRAATAGHNPPLLISIDQEGGQVKRLTNGPPTLSPPQMVSAGGPSVAGSQGRATGAYLKGLGINMDLAPVLDVPTFKGAFIWQQGRAFSFNPATVSSYGGAFALGLQAGGVAATGKHFPGLGSAGVSTDNGFDELHPTSAQLASALTPYRSLIPQGLDAVLVTTAAFNAYDPSGVSAAFSSKVIGGLLRGQLRFGGVVITDSLEAPTGHSEAASGLLAAEAGADVLLFTDSAPGVLGALESALAHGTISRSAAAASYRRIVALKLKLAG
jgi:beta-N-acetylhexosaminidase